MREFPGMLRCRIIKLQQRGRWGHQSRTWHVREKGAGPFRPTNNTSSSFSLTTLIYLSFTVSKRVIEKPLRSVENLLTGHLILLFACMEIKRLTVPLNFPGSAHTVTFFIDDKSGLGSNIFLILSSGKYRNILQRESQQTQCQITSIRSLWNKKEKY